MAMTNYLAVTTYPTKVKWHFLLNCQADRNEVLTYFFENNQEQMVTINADVLTRTMSIEEAPDLPSNSVELITLRGGLWECQVFQVTQMDIQSILDDASPETAAPKDSS